MQHAKQRIAQDPQRIRRRRIGAGLLQKELAEKTGFSPQQISQIERGDRGASPEALRRIALSLGCEIADLMPTESETAAR